MYEQVARSGLGFDVHRFTELRPLWLGGVQFDGEDGLLGHSDGDVVCHAIADALLGAAALGDLGEHFPDTDPKYRGADSRELLRAVRGLLAKHKIVNIDATILAQAPKMAPHFAQMTKNIAADLQVSESRINLKATTTERLGFAGRGEGIAAQAVALID